MTMIARRRIRNKTAGCLFGGWLIASTAALSAQPPAPPPAPPPAGPAAPRPPQSGAPFDPAKVPAGLGAPAPKISAAPTIT